MGRLLGPTMDYAENAMVRILLSLSKLVENKPSLISDYTPQTKSESTLGYRYSKRPTIVMGLSQLLSGFVIGFGRSFRFPEDRLSRV